MPEEKAFHNLDEVHEELLPNNILEDLEKRLCVCYGLNQSHQHRLVEDNKNSRTGFIEVAKPRKLHCLVSAIISNFYELRDFKILKNENTLLDVGKGSERYTIMIGNCDSSYEIWISEKTQGI